MKTLVLFSFLIGCSKTDEDSGASFKGAGEANEGIGMTDSDADGGDNGGGDNGGGDNGGGDDGVVDDTDTEEEVDDSLCAEDYSLCGDITIPGDYTGTPRSMAIVLYSSVPPAGPPEGIIAEIENPDLTAGATFPVRVLPALFNGEYYVWVNLYMEGGGEWAPVNDVDYVGYSAEPVVFDGTAISFDDISLSIATGW